MAGMFGTDGVRAPRAQGGLETSNITGRRLHSGSKSLAERPAVLGFPFCFDDLCPAEEITPVGQTHRHTVLVQRFFSHH